jgi:hypothetical protein
LFSAAAKCAEMLLADLKMSAFAVCPSNGNHAQTKEQQKHKTAV